MGQPLPALIIILINVHGPSDRANPYENEAVHQAEIAFWQAFNGGRYDQIPRTLNTVAKGLASAKVMAKAARSKHQTHLANACVGLMYARTAWLHLWRVSELPFYQDQMAVPEKEIPDLVMKDLSLASEYFQKAYDALSVSRPYPAGFQSQQPTIYMAVDSFRAASAFAYGTHLPEGDPQRAASLKNAATWLKQATDAYPAFHGFTQTAIRSDHSPPLARNLTKIWRILEGCSKTQFHRGFDGFNQNFGNFLKSTNPVAIPSSLDSTCVNTERAPHNFESQWMIFGDLLFLRENGGDLGQKKVQAADVYKGWHLALNSPDYPSHTGGTAPGTKPLPRNPTGWPSQKFLAKRLSLFKRDDTVFKDKVKNMTQKQRREWLKGNAFLAPGCLSCHQGK